MVKLFGLTSAPPELNSILGEKLLSGDRSSIYRNGIAQGKNYILWADVAELYVGGIKSTTNGIPSGEDRTIRIVDSTNKRIDFAYVSGFFRMKQESRQAFNDIYSMIIHNISVRQWGQFLHKIRNGGHYSFRVFEVTQDYLYFHKLFGGYDKKDAAYIKGCDIKDGYFFIHYQEPNKKLKTKLVGSVAKIPNIHIAQAFIDMVTKHRNAQDTFGTIL